MIGGGAIGCEFASMLSDMGVTVTVLEALPAILTGCDTEVAAVVGRSFKKRGIDVRTGVAITKVAAKKKSATISMEGAEDLSVDLVVVSVGRRPRTEGLVGEGTGVVVDERGFVVADRYQRTANPTVFAVGDVVAGTPQLAHVGFAEAIVAIKTMLGEPTVPVDYDRVPWAIYSNPEVAFCGLTEAAAKERGTTSWSRRTPSAATAARRSSARPRAWSRSSPRSAPTARPARSSASTWPGRG